MNKALKKRVERLVKEKIAIVPYNTDWPGFFGQEKNNLERILPKEIIS